MREGRLARRLTRHARGRAARTEPAANLRPAGGTTCSRRRGGIAVAVQAPARGHVSMREDAGVLDEVLARRTDHRVLTVDQAPHVRVDVRKRTHDPAVAGEDRLGESTSSTIASQAVQGWAPPEQTLVPPRVAATKAAPVIGAAGTDPAPQVEHAIEAARRPGGPGRVPPVRVPRAALPRRWHRRDPAARRALRCPRRPCGPAGPVARRGHGPLARRPAATVDGRPLAAREAEDLPVGGGTSRRAGCPAGGRRCRTPGPEGEDLGDRGEAGVDVGAHGQLDEHRAGAELSVDGGVVDGEREEASLHGHVAEAVGTGQPRAAGWRRRTG